MNIQVPALMKFQTAPFMRIALKDLRLEALVVLHPGTASYPLSVSGPIIRWRVIFRFMIP